ncbi:MAG: hypothetical protein RL685_6486 [Pseudomonadota bacterium]
MKTSWLKIAGVVSLAFAAAVPLGCGVEDIEQSGVDGDDTAAQFDELDAEEAASFGETEQGLLSCANPDGTNAAMAAFAVAVAQDLKRWDVGRDFVLNSTSGFSEGSFGPQQAIKLATGSDALGARGKSRCSDGRCARVQALLDMQYDQANNKVFFQGAGNTKVLLNPAALRSRMYAKWQEQRTCDQNARDGDSNSCSREQNALNFVSAAPGGCDTDFTFTARSSTGTALRFPNQLKHKLKFADSTNPYINFRNLGNGNVSIDPVYGLNDDGVTSSGACNTACTKFSISSMVGSCCSCGGVVKTLRASGFSPYVFVCL